MSKCLTEFETVFHDAYFSRHNGVLGVESTSINQESKGGFTKAGLINVTDGFRRLKLLPV